MAGGFRHPIHRCAKANEKIKPGQQVPNTFVVCFVPYGYVQLHAFEIHLCLHALILVPFCTALPSHLSLNILQDHLTERTIYERLGKHNKICKFKYAVTCGLVLGRLTQCLRKWLMDI